jgi:hypothetical protein
MRLDMLLVTQDTFVVIETKLHSPLQAGQIYLQQVLGRILNRLPGYEQHVFHHFLVSNTTHPKLRDHIGRYELPVAEPRALSWRQVVGYLPHISSRQQEEIERMLRPRRTP